MKKGRKLKQTKLRQNKSSKRFNFLLSVFLSSSCNRTSWSLTVGIRMTSARDHKLSIFVTTARERSSHYCYRVSFPKVNK